MFQPAGLPRHRAYEIGLLAQQLGERPGGRLGGFGIGAGDRDDKLAGVGKILLVEFQAVDNRKRGREQIEHFDVEAQPH